MLPTILADAAAAPDGIPWGSIIAPTSALGVVCFLLVYLVTKHLPAKDKASMDAITNIAQTHATAVKDVADKYQSSVTKVTDAFASEMDKQRTSCRDEREQIIELLRGEVSDRGKP